MARRWEQPGGELRERGAPARARGQDTASPQQSRRPSSPRRERGPLRHGQVGYVPRRSLDSQSEAGQQISPSGSAADAVHVDRQLRRERARPLGTTPPVPT